MINQRIPKPTYAPVSDGGGKWPTDEIYENIREDLEECDFTWRPVYEAVAVKLLGYRNNSIALKDQLYNLPTVAHYLQYFEDKTKDDSRVPLTDICPFTVMATFNLEHPNPKDEIVAADRVLVLKELCEFLGVEPKPDIDFPGVPTLPLRNPLFFADSKTRFPGDIKALWNAFSAAMDYVRKNSLQTRTNFSTAYDVAIGVQQTKWNLSIGLFWISTEHFFTLDQNSRLFIEKLLGVPIPPRTPNEACSSKTYFDLMSTFRAYCKGSKYPFNNFTELSRTARMETPPYQRNKIGVQKRRKGFGK